MTVTSSDPSANPERTLLFEEAPELLQQRDQAAQDALRRVTTDVLELRPGAWQLDFTPDEMRGHLGLLVLDGLLSRQVTVGDVASAELLGSGDVLRPWTEFNTEIVSIPAETKWQVGEPTRLAVLDARFALRIARWPDVTAAIVDRHMQRARWLAFHLAVCHIVGVDVRLMLVMWHFADRWGKVTPAGILLPIQLPHGMLAAIVGARRPTVSTAISGLRGDGLLERTNGGWLLHGSPPPQLETLRRRVAGREATIET